MSGYTEDHLTEQPAIQLMEHELGWDTADCFGEWVGGTSFLGRDGKREVVLTGRLKPVRPIAALVKRIDIWNI